MKEHLTTLLAAGVPTQRVAQSGFDVVAAIELLIVVAIAVSNWIWKRKKDKDAKK